MSKVSQEKLLETLTEIAEKLDRCAKIAKRKYKVWPSAYASGAAVKCRQGKIWKGIKENNDNSSDQSNIIFVMKSPFCPKKMKYDHIGFVLQDGSLKDMSGHRYTEDGQEPMPPIKYKFENTEKLFNLPKNKNEAIAQGLYKEKKLPKIVSVPSQVACNIKDPKEKSENCGSFVKIVLKNNGIETTSSNFPEDIFNAIKLNNQKSLEEVISQDEAKEQIKNAQQELTIAKNNVKNAEEKLKLAQNVLRTAARFRQRAASSSVSPTATTSPESDILSTLSEAVYAGNLGMMEVHKFMTEAPDELKQKFQEFLDAGMENEAWDMVKKFTHSELQGIGTPGSSDETGSLEEKKEYKPNFSKEKKQGLHGWFSRNKGKGWVDCKTGKPCGRQKTGRGTDRPYPACRPTKSQCNKVGPKRKKGSKPISWKPKSEK